ncbi:MAG: tRNA lysidine(34) synthetase TilS [Dehalococcoidia bacterium]
MTAGSKYGRRFEQRLQEAIKRDRLLQKGERVLVAFSGGPDSTALLHSLTHLRNHLKVELGVAHFDHRLRDGSDSEVEFCRAVATDFGLAFFTAAADVRAMAASLKLSLEDAARQARYGFLNTVAKEHGFGVVATGHHAGDQAETLLMRLVRGSGAGGLGAMRARATLPVPGSAVALVRPLLDFARHEVLRYCDEERLAYLEDPSNHDLAFTRNRLRCTVLPALREINPEVESALGRAARALARDEDFLDKQARSALNHVTLTAEPLTLNRAALLAQDDAIVVRVLRLATEQLGVALRGAESEKLLALARAGRGRLDISKEWRVELSKFELSFAARPADSDPA